MEAKLPAPRLSLMLMVYNQRSTVAAAAAACLAQSGEPIEVLLSDDASTDGSGEVLAQLAADYRGPHQVRLNRNPVNLGIGAHFNRMVELTRGELLVVAAGDDVSLPQRCDRLLQAWDAARQQPDLIASPLLDMDAAGQVHGRIEVDPLDQWTLERWCRHRPRVIGAGHAWTRRAFERFGPLASDIAYEDQVMTLRALLCGGAVTLDEPLVRYRRGGTSAKALPTTAAGVRQRMRVQNRRHLAEVHQLCQDAAKAGQAALLHPALQAEWQRQSCLRDLLDSNGWWSIIQAARRQVGPAWPWRLRKLMAVQCAGLTALKYRRRARG